MMKEKDDWRSDFDVPLTDSLREILDDAKETAIDGFLFVGARTRKPITHEAVEKQFRRLTDGEHVPHGSRTSLFTYALEEHKARKAVAQSLIDHATATGADTHYNAAEYYEERQPILTAWADLICG